jgi:hypothetical protein
MAVFARRTPYTTGAPASNAWGVQYLISPDNDLAPDIHSRLRAAVAAGAFGEAAEKPESAAASDTENKNASPDVWATVVATVVFVAALLVSAAFLFFTEGGPTFKATEGIGAFALFYIVAQAAERLVEMVVPYFDRRPGGKNAKVANRDRKLVAAKTGERDDTEKDEKERAKDLEVQAANAQAEVDQVRANRTALVFGFTAAIGILLCGYLEADFLTAVGVTFEPVPPPGTGPGPSPGFGNELVMLAVTGLIVGGGSKALHDTISNISKTSEKKSTPPETGGDVK